MALLEAALRARFATRTEPFTEGSLAFELLLPRTADELIDERQFERDERLPYWAELWPSARALARHLARAPLPGGRVLELGCGLGLPSLVLLARGAHVLATDYYADALRFAEANAARNGLPPLSTALLDWREPLPRLGRFDLVAAADVLYEPRYAELLAELLPGLVSARGRVLLADPGRVYLGAFGGRLVAAGWSVRHKETREEISDARSGARSRIQILEYRRSDA